MKFYGNSIVRLLDGSIDLSTVRSISKPTPELYRRNDIEYYSGRFYINIGFNCIEQTTSVAIFFYDGIANKRINEAYNFIDSGVHKAEQEYETLITEWAKSIR